MDSTLAKLHNELHFLYIYIIGTQRGHPEVEIALDISIIHRARFQLFFWGVTRR